MLCVLIRSVSVRRFQRMPTTYENIQSFLVENKKSEKIIPHRQINLSKIYKISNRKADLYHINANIKFGENSLTFTQVIDQK